MTTRDLRPLLLIVIGACGGGEAGGGDDGGNVGFGGAQDIGQFRSILDAGQIPGEETFDANGFFNEHYSELPPATCGQTLCLEPMLSVGRDWTTAEHQATLQIALTTPIDPATLERLPLDMVAVVDRSGSMLEDGRMDKVKQGLHILIDSLEPGDRLALVQFDDVVNVLNTLDAQTTPEALHALVDDMFARGATNIHGGLQQGFEIAIAARVPERQSRVILLSDGLATAGITDGAEIISMADGYIEGGTSLTTIGVGLDFDVALMRGLAEHGAGNFYFLEDAAAVNEVFTQELEVGLTPIALGVQIDALSTSQYRIGDVVGTRLWSSTSDGGGVRIPAVFVASREGQIPEPGRRGGGGSIFVQLEPIGGAAGDGSVARVTLRYRIPGETEERTQTVTITNPNQPGETPQETYVSQLAMLEHFAMYNAYLGLHAATRAADTDYACALAILDATRDRAAAWNAWYGDDPDIEADIMLMDQFIDNLIAVGAVRGNATSSCLVDDGPGDDDFGDDHHHHGLYCAAGAGSSAKSLAPIALALAFALRRRRRRG
jgi:Ca-activated chloride channel family protein